MTKEEEETNYTADLILKFRKLIIARYHELHSRKTDHEKGLKSLLKAYPKTLLGKLVTALIEEMGSLEEWKFRGDSEIDYLVEEALKEARNDN